MTIASARAYNRAIDCGDYESAMRIDAEDEAAFYAKHPDSLANVRRLAESAYTAQQRLACWDDGDISTVTHDPRNHP